MFLFCLSDSFSWANTELVPSLFVYHVFFLSIEVISDQVCLSSISLSARLLLCDKGAWQCWSVFICSEEVSPVSCSCLISSCLRLSDLSSCLLSSRVEHPARPSLAHYLLICLLSLGMLQTHAVPRACVCIYSGSLKRWQTGLKCSSLAHALMASYSWLCLAW